MKFRFALSGATLALCAFGFAQSSLTPIKGQQEFSGRLIVKPKLESAYTVQGLSSTQAANSRYKSIKAIEATTLRRESDTDEYIIGIPKGLSDASYAKQLMATGAYEYVSPDWKLAPAVLPNDARYSSQWHHSVIHSPDAWNLVSGVEPTSALKIAVCDTGVESSHPDLRENMLPGYNAVSGKTVAQGGATNDVNGHGTHVAGCAAAQGNNKIGVSGVIWRVKVLPVRVTDDPTGSASLSNILRGVRWAVDNGAKSVSVSYSGADSTSIETTGAYAKSKGALLLWAGGNDNRNLSGFDHPDVILVGASDQKDAKASFSAYGKAIDVFAPGVGIWSTVRNSGYEAWSGTSMATPVTNGLVALIWAANPRLTASQVEEVLFKSCKDLGPVGNDDYWGWGRIDAFAAVKLARATTGKAAFAPAVGSRSWLYGELLKTA